jgi:hypothetical protein
MHELTPLLISSLTFAYATAVIILIAGLYLSVKRGRLHPLLLLAISAFSISWIEAPYDWATYAQFHPALPRMPSWWPLNETYGGLPSSVPLGYISYFITPAIAAAALGSRLIARFHWRTPQTWLMVGLGIGFFWALVFNGLVGARLGVFYYGHVIEGLAIFPGTRHQYPLYDALAMGIQMMVFTYILGRTDHSGRTLVEVWADSRARTKFRSALLSIGALVVIANVLYLAVFAPHLITKVLHLQKIGPTGQLFPGIQNQPL